MDTKENTDAEVYLNPRTDFGFKKIFWDKELLIDFLNEIIGGKACIIDVEYMPNELLGEWDTDRKAVFDLYCKNSKEEYFIVEMQKARQTDIIERSLFYTSYSIRNQAPKGKWNYKLKAVYLIAILDFTVFKEKKVKDEYIEHVYLYREQAKKKLSNKLNMIFIELSKFTKQPEELKTKTDQWLYILKNLENLKSRPAEVQGNVFKKLFEIAEIKKLSKEDMEKYKTSILEYDSIKNAIKLERVESRREGRREGRKEGRKEGREEARREMIKQFLQEGMSIELLSKYTKLTVEQIEDISKN